MDPISSSVGNRAATSPAPQPAQQRRDQEAITASQPRADSFSTSAPGQDVALQRRQAVEDTAKSEKSSDQVNPDQTLQVAAEASRQRPGAEFPRIVEPDNRADRVRSEEQAEALARQTRQDLQQQSGAALLSQASNVSRQTALTLFQ